MIKFATTLMLCLMPTVGHAVQRCSGVDVTIKTLPLISGGPPRLICGIYREGHQIHFEFLNDHLSLLRRGMSENLDGFISKVDTYRINPMASFASVVLKVRFSEDFLEGDIRYISFEPSAVLSGLRHSIDLRRVDGSENQPREIFLLSFIHFFEYCDMFSSNSQLIVYTANSPTKIKSECILLSSQDIYDNIWKRIEMQ